uniref:Rho family GTPase 3 n=1 Tax=Gallus gallus TaxID=9031 RepID=A0A8V0Y2V7_CHICK
MKERRASQKLSSKAVMDPNQNVKCKIVVVGDSQCGKTALLHVFAKDCFPELRPHRLRELHGQLRDRHAAHRAQPSENSVRDIFHVATLACVNKTNKNVKRNKSQRATKRISHMPGRPELSTVATDLRKDKAKSCTVM